METRGKKRRERGRVKENEWTSGEQRRGRRGGGWCLACSLSVLSTALHGLSRDQRFPVKRERIKTVS